MASVETDNFEETLVKDIEDLKIKIEKNEKELAEDKKFLGSFERALVGRRRNVFFQKYGTDPLEVKYEYSTHLQKHSHLVKKDKPGYKVSCSEYEIKTFPELVLSPEHREKCLPTQKEIDAYAFFGETVSIAEELSYE